ncbi:uncharacterized protein LOC120440088 isoform X2 [Oreochromis aureus]|uniref:uncharacterized protein LOC120440088 isoform X2 n=1 Tax=Oreochromis aureus TaxID=47969 RepID=UPI001953CBFA|nr:uncharacterized protein LOC120440088 isoform X2 [Oreochromis aureus]
MADEDPQGPRPRAQSCSSGTGHKRAQKYTERGLEDQLGRHINARRSKLSQLTLKMNKIRGLMKENESLDIVDEHLSNFSKLHEEFLQANDDVLSLLPEDERNVVQMLWLNPKKEQFSGFMTEVEKWIILTRHQYQDGVSPDDSVSVTARPTAKKSGTSVRRSSVSSRSSRWSRVLSVSSVWQKEEAERAALLARAASLKQRQALDIEECGDCLEGEGMKQRSRWVLRAMQGGRQERLAVWRGRSYRQLQTRIQESLYGCGLVGGFQMLTVKQRNEVSNTR